MRTRNMLVRWGWAAALATVVAIGMASEASAGVVRILPERFRFVDQESGIIFPQFVGTSSSGQTYLWAPVRLPVGARVMKLLYYHWGSQAGAVSSVSLWKGRMGEAPFQNGDVLMAATCDWYDGNWEALPPQTVSTTEPAYPESDLVVRPGYRYWVLLFLDHSGVGGVKVFYSRLLKCRPFHIAIPPGAGYLTYRKGENWIRPGQLRRRLRAVAPSPR